MSTSPPIPDVLLKQAVAHHGASRLAEAEQLYRTIIEALPSHAEAHHGLGIINAQRGHPELGIPHFKTALEADPGHSRYWQSYAGALLAAGRAELAIQALEAARHRGLSGTVLDELLNQARATLDEGLGPNLHAIYLAALRSHQAGRLTEAAMLYRQVIVARPDFAPTHLNLGDVFRLQGKLNDAVESCRRAIKIKPNFSQGYYGLGGALCENSHVEEGLAAFRHHAELVHATKSSSAEPELAHKLRHDQEQHAYLNAPSSTMINEMFYFEDGERLKLRAINTQNDTAQIGERWRTEKPQFVVIDNLISADALHKIRRFCLGSTIWRKVYDDGYLGAFPEHGFACPLLAQIAEELRETFPEIFVTHQLTYLWAFKYDCQLGGIKVHADMAAVNVNFWITPDEANLDPQSGGLVIWDVAAPRDWEDQKFNGDISACREFLKRNNAKSITVPYRCNRAVIFDSDLFHETDKITFKDGYLNRRINITLLYGRR